MGDTKSVRIGCGAGFAGDRLEPAVDLAERGELDFLVLECLAERTIALAQRRRLLDGAPGYDPMLDRRLRPILPKLGRSGLRLITNMGAADPLAAGEQVARLAREVGVAIKVASLTGDDVLELLDRGAAAWEDGVPLEEHGELLSANAYLGAEALVAAIATGADVIITGRVADPSLFVAPLVHRFGWAFDDWPRLGRATLVGHLLECGAQLTGGYFADPPFRVVQGLERIGYPVATVAEDGGAAFSKLERTGGRLDIETVCEQLAYEVEDPSTYITPDVVADFTGVRIVDHGRSVVSVTGATGRAAPEMLKVSVGFRAGYRCEAEISYAGRGAVQRADLAGRIVAARLPACLEHLRCDLVGVDAVFGHRALVYDEPRECRLRVSGRHADQSVALAIAEEVTALYTTGPAGGAGVRTSIEEVIGVLSTTIPRDAVRPVVHQADAAS